MFHQIQKVRTVPHRNVLLTFEDGDLVLFDLSRYIAKGGIFAALDDEKAFADVQIEDDGHSLVWPGGIDFFAETLWREGTHVIDHDQRQDDEPSTAPPPA